MQLILMLLYYIIKLLYQNAIQILFGYEHSFLAVLAERINFSTRVNISIILILQGVRSVVTAKDVPGSNVAGLANDELVFAEDKVTAIGQLIAIVVAENKLLAKQAVKLVKVTYKDLPAILTIEVRSLSSVYS